MKCVATEAYKINPDRICLAIMLHESEMVVGRIPTKILLLADGQAFVIEMMVCHGGGCQER